MINRENLLIDYRDIKLDIEYCEKNPPIYDTKILPSLYEKRNLIFKRLLYGEQKYDK